MEKFKDLHEKASWLRGEFLNRFSWLEKCIDNYIAKHFAGDDVQKQIDMHLLFLGDNRVTMDNKKQIFHFLAESYDLEWYKSYKSEIFEIPSKKRAIAMNRDLTELIVVRNIFAHRIVELNPEEGKKNGYVGFATYKNYKDVTYIGDEYFLRMINAMYSITDYVDKRSLKL
ncbi:hypothetical protein SAMN04488511_11991 [Pedobacter suwonensis]|uniref:Uncharacterized protein n=1 Tax=Pedobacter suwonensis TaxID=332999 RepID=A0A1I0U3K7_9SPHI|nr:hypothetical protein [Pedobacter suwonensis]SFA58530.1 hypothetical protein SAMN04488511_11991 [Pedobacter suwonensis]